MKRIVPSLFVLFFCAYSYVFGQGTAIPSMGCAGDTIEIQYSTVKSAPPNSATFNGLSSTITATTSTTVEVIVPALPPGTNNISVSIGFTDSTIITATFNTYPTLQYATTICKLYPNQSPINAPLTNTGSFSATPPGNLVFANANTGEIDVSASSPGNYTISYSPGNGNSFTYCGGNSVNITIHPSLNPSFSYSQASFCKWGINPLPNFTQSFPISNFSINPASPGFNPTTGLIDLAQIAPSPQNSPYVVVRSATDNNNCVYVASTTVEIRAYDTIRFDYSGGGPGQDTLCKNSGTYPANFFQGNSFNGTFSMVSPTNAGSYLKNDGKFKTKKIPTGTYVVQFTSNPIVGMCAGTSTDTILILNAKDPFFEFNDPDSTLCTYDSLGTINLLGNIGGFFSTPQPSLLALDTTNGNIDIGQSTPGGPYTVKYEVSFGTCVVNDEHEISIATPDELTYHYPNNSYCQNVSDPMPIGANFTPSSFYALGLGGIIDSTDGRIDLGKSSPNIPLVFAYETFGVCPVTLFDTITINPLPNISFDYPDTICASHQPFTSLTPFPNASGGFYQPPTPLAGAPWTSPFDTVTGTLSAGPQNVGTYEISYSIPGACPATLLDTVEILPMTDPSFHLDTNFFCLKSPLPEIHLTGDTGGIFFSLPAYLSAKDSAGTTYLDLPDSNLNAYLQTYTLIYQSPGCMDRDSFVVTLEEHRKPNFFYSSHQFCRSSESQSPIPATGFQPGGHWKSVPAAGVHLNDSSGVFSPEKCTIDSFTIWYVIKNCPDSASWDVVLLDNLPAEFSYAGDTAFCNGSSQSTAIPQPYMNYGIWEDTTGLLGLSLTDGSFSPIGVPVGIYEISHFTEDSTGLCKDTFSVVISISASDTAQLRYPEDTLCPNDLEMLPMNFIAGNYIGVGVDADSGGLDPTKIPPSLNPYNVVVQFNNACQDLDSIQIWVLPYDKADFSYSPPERCQDDTLSPVVPIPVLSGGTYYENTGTLVFRDSSGNLQTDSSATGEIHLMSSKVSAYSLSYTTNGPCPATSTSTFEIFPVPEPKLETDQPGKALWACEEDEVFLTATNTDTDEMDFTFTSFPNPINNNLSIDDFCLIKGITPGLNTVNVTVGYKSQFGGCAARDSLIFEFRPRPNVTLDPFQEFNLSGDDPIFLNLESDAPATWYYVNVVPTGNLLGINWTDSTNIAPQGAYQPVPADLVINWADEVTPANIDITYLPIARECAGQEGSASLFVMPIGNEVFIPSLISPNGDGHNDSWWISWTEDFDPSQYYFSIFNRAGAEVHRIDDLLPLSDPATAWQGEGLIDGVYYWILFRKDGIPNQKGGLVIQSLGN